METQNITWCIDNCQAYLMGDLAKKELERLLSRLAQLEAAQPRVQPTCSTCGAKLRSGDIWWNECEKCHSKIASG